jgi:hypothetical protein
VGLDPLDLTALRAGQRANVVVRTARPAATTTDSDVDVASV